jgi:type 1 glutamine amidotransferase
MSWRTLLAVGLSLCLVRPGLADAPKKLLLIGQGPDGHPPQSHEYMAGQRILQKILERVPGLTLKIVRADEPWRKGPELLRDADGVVLYLAEGAKWIHQDPKRLAALQQLAARGGGIVALHWAIGTREAKNVDGFVKLVGGCHGGPDRKYIVLAADVEVADSGQPATSGIKNFKVRDEFYYRLKFIKSGDNLHPLLRVRIDGQPETVAWSWERPDGGRSFGFSGLHFHENWRLPEYRRLAAQGVLWTLKLPVPSAGLDVNVGERDLQLK